MSNQAELLKTESIFDILRENCFPCKCIFSSSGKFSQLFSSSQWKTGKNHRVRTNFWELNARNKNKCSTEMNYLQTVVRSWRIILITLDIMYLSKEDSSKFYSITLSRKMRKIFTLSWVCWNFAWTTWWESRKRGYRIETVSWNMHFQSNL